MVLYVIKKIHRRVLFVCLFVHFTLSEYLHFLFWRTRLFPFQQIWKNTETQEGRGGVGTELATTDQKVWRKKVSLIIRNEMMDAT